MATLQKMSIWDRLLRITAGDCLALLNDTTSEVDSMIPAEVEAGRYNPGGKVFTPFGDGLMCGLLDRYPDAVSLAPRLRVA